MFDSFWGGVSNGIRILYTVNGGINGIELFLSLFRAVFQRLTVKSGIIFNGLQV